MFAAVFIACFAGLVAGAVYGGWATFAVVFVLALAVQYAIDLKYGSYTS